MAYITRAHFYKYYKNYLFTQTGCFFMLIYIFALVFPFLFAVSTGELWREIDWATEQPIVTPTGQYAIECTDGVTVKLSSNIYGTDDADYSTQLADWNMDGRPEILEFNIQQSTTFSASSCIIMMPLNVGFRMIAPVMFSVNEDFTNFKLNLVGSLIFSQRNALPSSRMTRSIYNSADYDLTNGLRSFKPTQNETMEAVVVRNLMMKGGSDTTTVEISGSLSLPVFQEILYKPTVMVNFKEVWIQYVFIAIPTFFLVNKLGSFVLKNKIFFAHQQVDNEKYQMD